MDLRVVIGAVLDQSATLVAHLATRGGQRAILSNVSSRMFLGMTRALQESGISRRVQADMFGMDLRAFRRKLRRVEASATDGHVSLWRAMLLEFRQREASQRAPMSLDDLTRRFHRDGEDAVRAVLADMVESGIVARKGTRSDARYLFTSMNETPTEKQRESFAAALIFRQGPLGRDELGARLDFVDDALDALIDTLVSEGRIQQNADGAYEAPNFVVELGQEQLWASALVDHFTAVTKTIITRLQKQGTSTWPQGGSTYKIDLWEGHPYESECLDFLEEFRTRYSALRQKTEAWNASHKPDGTPYALTVYGGQLPER
jgi:hypothetical protein